MILNRIAGVTLSTPDFDSSATVLSEALGYVSLETGHVSRQLAEFWSAPCTAGRRYACFGPKSGEETFVRIVESPHTPGYEPLKTFGWNATEIHVADVYGLAESLAGSSLDIIGGPRDLLNNGTAVALQTQGPSDEIYYLTEINSDTMQRSYGKAESAVGRIFIVVLGCRLHDVSRTFYAQIADGVPRARRLSIRVLANAHGLDPYATQFPIGSAILREPYRIELDGYPDSATTRPTLDGHLPPGLSMVSFETDSFSESPYTPVKSTSSLDGAPYCGRGAQILHGPDGEWLELIECR